MLRSIHAAGGGLLLLLGAALGLACATAQLPAPTASGRVECPAGEAEVYRRAESARATLLAHQLERLRADLAEAESTLVAVESGLRATHTRADAVSALAEARIQLGRAEERVSWRPEAFREARGMLLEAERQLESSHFGSAMYFVSRAERIAAGVLTEADSVAKDADARFVRARRVNLRSGPSTGHEVSKVLVGGTPVMPERQEGEWVMIHTLNGRVGWIHGSLLRSTPDR